MQLQPSHEILSSFPDGHLPAPEAWRASLRPGGWSAAHPAEVLFGDWDEIFWEEDVVLSPELDAAYDRAIDAAFAKVAALLYGPDGCEREL
jgi:hypothetical protein